MSWKFKFKLFWAFAVWWAVALLAGAFLLDICPLAAIIASLTIAQASGAIIMWRKPK